jgi:hypothetical protein
MGNVDDWRRGDLCWVNGAPMAEDSESARTGWRAGGSFVELEDDCARWVRVVSPTFGSVVRRSVVGCLG